MTFAHIIETRASSPLSLVYVYLLNVRTRTINNIQAGNAHFGVKQVFAKLGRIRSIPTTCKIVRHVTIVRRTAEHVAAGGTKAFFRSILAADAPPSIRARKNPSISVVARAGGCDLVVA